MKIENIEVGKLEHNKGQIEGLPKNPRIIKDKQYKALVKSIEEAPEMLTLRELIVVPKKEKYVVVCGNMRLKACKQIGYAELPCKVLPEDTPPEKLREYAVKDNVPYGEDDIVAYLNEWNKDELSGWGLELPEKEDTKQLQEEAEEVETKGFARSHVLLSFPPEMMEQVGKLLEQLQEYDDIVIRKASNGYAGQ